MDEKRFVATLRADLQKQLNVTLDRIVVVVELTSIASSFRYVIRQPNRNIPGHLLVAAPFLEAARYRT